MYYEGSINPTWSDSKKPGTTVICDCFETAMTLHEVINSLKETLDESHPDVIKEIQKLEKVVKPKPAKVILEDPFYYERVI